MVIAAFDDDAPTHIVDGHDGAAPRSIKRMANEDRRLLRLERDIGRAVSGQAGAWQMVLRKQFKQQEEEQAGESSTAANNNGGDTVEA